MQESPSLPPLVRSVRTTTVLTLAPFMSQPAALDGQYLRPLITYSPFLRSAVTWIPALGSGWSKLAVPPGLPAGSETTQPARKLLVGSLHAMGSHFLFCCSEPCQTIGMRARPLTSRTQPKPGSTAPISSTAMRTSTLLSPPPPYSL